LLSRKCVHALPEGNGAEGIHGLLLLLPLHVKGHARLDAGGYDRIHDLALAAEHLQEVLLIGACEQLHGGFPLVAPGRPVCGEYSVSEYFLEFFCDLLALGL